MPAVKKHEQSLYISNNMAIPAYDYVDFQYDSDNNPTTVVYYRGGNQDSGKKVGEIVMTYDSNSNLISVERVS